MTLLEIVRRFGRIALIGAVLGFATLGEAPALDAGDVDSTIVAQAGGTEPRELQPRYQPAPPEPEPAYNDSYIFALTRGVADSTMHPAAKACLFLFTIPIDLVVSPIAAIGGFF